MNSIWKQSNIFIPYDTIVVHWKGRCKKNRKAGFWILKTTIQLQSDSIVFLKWFSLLESNWRKIEWTNQFGQDFWTLFPVLDWKSSQIQYRIFTKIIFLTEILIFLSRISNLNYSFEEITVPHLTSALLNEIFNSSLILKISDPENLIFTQIILK